MSDHVTAHFQSVLATPFSATAVFSAPLWFEDLQPFRISSLLMISIPSAEEIKALVFKLNPNKAPGPDGLTSGFFKAAWEVVGNEFVDVVRHFFLSGFLPSSANTTILTLIPKFPGASRVAEYRPISCLNTIYKVVSRLLVRRIKPILSELIMLS